MTARRAHERVEDGSTLILILIIMVLAGLITVPLLTYTFTTIKSATTVRQKADRAEAAKGGIRLSLAKQRDRGTAGCIPNKASALVLNGAVVDVACQLLVRTDNAPAGKSEVVAGSITGSSSSTAAVKALTGRVTVGASQASLPRDLSATSCAKAPCFTSVSSWVTKGDTVDLPTVDQAWNGVSEAIYLRWDPPDPPDPRAPVYAVTLNGCRLFYPGLYRGPLDINLDDGPVYLVSGVYSFEDTVTVTGTGRLVAGSGAATGCATDAQAVGRVSHALSNGDGVLFVFGNSGRLDVGPRADLTLNSRVAEQPGSAQTFFNILQVPPGIGPSDERPYSASTLTTESTPIVRISAGNANNVAIFGRITVPYGLVKLEEGPGSTLRGTLRLPERLTAGALSVDLRKPTRPTRPTGTAFQIGSRYATATVRLTATARLGTGDSAVSTAVVQVADDGRYAITSWRID